MWACVGNRERESESEKNKESQISVCLYLKTEYMCYNQTGNITTLDGASLKLVDKFT